MGDELRKKWLNNASKGGEKKKKRRKEEKGEKNLTMDLINIKF